MCIYIYRLPGIPGVSMSQFSCTSPKTNMDTQNHALERWTSLKKYGHVYDFLGIYVRFLRSTVYTS